MDRLFYLFGLLIVILTLHLIEEIGGDFRRKFPLGAVPLPLFIIANVVIYGYTITALYLSYLKIPVANTMMLIFTIFMFLNGIGHIGMMIYKKKYFPGGITAFPLLLLSIYIMQLLFRL